MYFLFIIFICVIIYLLFVKKTKYENFEFKSEEQPKQVMGHP